MGTLSIAPFVRYTTAMKDVILIPTYNERELIGDLIEEVFRVVPDAIVMVIDDNSPDDTAGAVCELQERYPGLQLHVRPEKRGLGSAYVEVFTKLVPDESIRTITTMDADWSHHPRHLPELLRESEHADVVIGSRYVDGGSVPDWELWRRLLSWGGNMYARVVAGVPIRDLTAGFVCFHRTLLARIDLSQIHSEGYAYTIESKVFAHRLGARIREIPITFEERRGGESKISHHIIREGLLAPWRIRFMR